MGYFGKCSSGTCPLTATPWRGAFFGLMLGALFALSFSPGRGADHVAAAEKKVVRITGTESFRTRVEKADGPVLVKFGAPWCGWCRKLEPVLEELADDYGDRLSFVKVNTDDHKDIAGRFDVRGLPTMILFNGGRQVERIVGYRDGKGLRKILEGHLK